MKALNRNFFVLLLGSCGAAVAGDGPVLDVHGALAQGYVISGGNNFLGDSIHGSQDLVEVAVNVRTSLTPKLLASAQFMAREAGGGDDGELRIDYALLDWQLLSDYRQSAGLRLGKVKTTYGFFNDSRDVVFSRPGILLPSSVYYEGVGLRDLFFSAEGGQLYGNRSFGSNNTSLVLGVARDFDATEQFERSLTGANLDGTVNVNNYRTVQWLSEWNGGRQRTGLSLLSAELDYAANNPNDPLAGFGLKSDNYVLSLEHLGRSYSVTFEYRYSVTSTSSAAGRDRSSADGAYLQYRQFVGRGIEWFLRYDVAFNNRNDRDGREAEAATGAPRYSQFAYNHVVGAQWRLDSGWGLFAEYHYMDGTAFASSVDNMGRDLERYWQMALFMIAYRF